MIKDYKPKISEYKKKEVKEVIDLFNKYKVVALVNLEDLPAYQLHKMRKQLRDKVVFKMSRKSFIQIALDQVKKPNVDQLRDKIEGMPALMFTNENPFQLYKLIDKNKSPAPAKAGQISPIDLIIPAGPTSFAPGPMIGELGQLGIKTEVKEGKISLREDKLLVKKGDVINQRVAELLPKFGIEPMEIGLNLILTYENGELLFKDILSITDEHYLNEIKKAFSESLALALHIGYVTKETAKLFVQKAYREAKTVSKKGNLEVNEEIKKLEVKPETKREEFKEIKQEPMKQVIKQPILKEPIQEEKAVHSSNDNVVIESKKPVDLSGADKAQEVLRKLQDQGVESLKKKDEEKKKEEHKKQEKDINKIINQLKDKKARGEI